MQKRSAGVNIIAEQCIMSVQGRAWVLTGGSSVVRRKKLDDRVSVEDFGFKPVPYNRKKKSVKKECILKLS